MVVRRDLSGSQQAVQGIHAAIEAARSGLIPRDVEHPHLVLAGVESEAALYLLSRKLEAAGVAHSVFREPDIGNEMTALATEPLDRRDAGFLRKLRLLELGAN